MSITSIKSKKKEKLDPEDFIKDTSISLIEKAFSFKPDNRRGYLRLRRENRISDSIGIKLYNNRIKISRSILAHSDLPKKKALIQALIDNNISPNSVTGWLDYVNHLIGVHGGWDVFCRDLDHSLRFFDYYKSKNNVLIYYACMLAIVLASVMLCIGSFFHMWGVFSIVLILAPVLFYMIGYVYVEYSYNLHAKDLLGWKKTPHYLYSYRKLRPYIAVHIE